MDYTSKKVFLSRQHLLREELDGVVLEATNLIDERNYRLYDIQGLARKNEEKGRPYEVMKNCLIGLSSLQQHFFYIIKGNRRGLSVKLALPDNQARGILDNLSSHFAQLSIEEGKIADLVLPSKHAGFVVGIPKLLQKDEQVPTFFPLLQALVGKEFSIVLGMKPLALLRSKPLHNHILQELRTVSKDVNLSLSQKGAIGDRQVQEVDYAAKSYQEHLEHFETMFNQAMSSGLWQVQCLLTADSSATYHQLANAFKGQFSEQEGILEHLKMIPIRNSELLADSKLAVFDIRDESYPEHPLASSGVQEMGTLNQSLMSSYHLTTYFQFPEQELPGFAIDDAVNFDTDSRRKSGSDSFQIGQILNTGRQLDNPYHIPLNDLTRHALIIGMTGSGKTNTSKSLLTELWLRHRVPFLVIESAKREYWDLANINEEFSNTLVFTLGQESLERGVPYRLNPFEVIGTASLQAHIDRIFATFKASFDLVNPTPFILEQALHAIYEDYGWDIVTGINNMGQATYPTLTDLVLKIDDIVQNSGYTGELKSNIEASLRARINSLRLGGKGMMLDVERSFPIEQLLHCPTVLELEDLGDDETKSFVIGLLLTQLYEYRQSYNQAIGSSDLSHLLIIEEAHRLLAKEEQADSSKAKAITFFTNLLAEIRSFGQGIMIADQIPTKLASDTLKNTNLKIVHRTVMQEDRDIIGDAMNMADDQKSYLSNLYRGTAAIYAEGDSHPKLVQLPLVTSQLNQKRESILRRTYQQVAGFFQIKRQVPKVYEEFLKNFSNPLYRQEVDGILQQLKESKNFLTVLKTLGDDFIMVQTPTISEVEKNELVQLIIEHLPISRALKREYLARYKKELINGRI